MKHTGKIINGEGAYAVTIHLNKNNLKNILSSDFFNFWTYGFISADVFKRTIDVDRDGFDLKMLSFIPNIKEKYHYLIINGPGVNRLYIIKYKEANYDEADLFYYYSSQ